MDEFILEFERLSNCIKQKEITLPTQLVVSNLRSKTKGSQFESSCYLCAEVNSLQ